MRNLIAVAAIFSILTTTIILSERSADAETCAFNLTNVKRGPQYDNYSHGPDWEVIGFHPQTLSFNHALGYTNTFSATVTVSAQVVSAALGFQVSKQMTTQVGSTYPVPQDGHRWKLVAGTVDRTVTFDVVSSCKPGVVGNGYAKETGPITVKTVRFKSGSYEPEGCGARPC